MSRSPGLSASRRHVSAAARVYSSLDARSTVRVSTDDGRDLLTRPGCGRPNARTRRQNYPRDVVSLHASSRRRRACGRPCDVAPVSEERTPSGCAAPTRRRGSTGAPNPVRQSARLAETAIARETVARRRRAGPGSLSLSVALSPLSVDRRDGTPSCRPVRGPPACSCWHITPGGGRRRRRRRQHTYKESQCRRSRG